jgi:hypothetical protein
MTFAIDGTLTGIVSLQGCFLTFRMSQFIYSFSQLSTYHFSDVCSLKQKDKYVIRVMSAPCIEYSVCIASYAPGQMFLEQHQL